MNTVRDGLTADTNEFYLRQVTHEGKSINLKTKYLADWDVFLITYMIFFKSFQTDLDVANMMNTQLPFFPRLGNKTKEMVLKREQVIILKEFSIVHSVIMVT